MDEQKYLSEEEQYEKVLDKEKIARIKDPILRDIRYKYWELRHKAHIDELNFPVSEWDRICALEQDEISEYKANKMK